MRSTLLLFLILRGDVALLPLLLDLPQQLVSFVPFILEQERLEFFHAHPFELVILEKSQVVVVFHFEIVVRLQGLSVFKHHFALTCIRVCADIIVATRDLHVRVVVLLHVVLLLSEAVSDNGVCAVNGAGSYVVSGLVAFLVKALFVLF
jgi:hypothetical protein